MAEGPTTNGANGAKLPKHSISFIIGSGYEGDKATIEPRDNLRRNRGGARSAFKEVHKRNQLRYNPLVSTPNNTRIPAGEQEEGADAGESLQSYYYSLFRRYESGKRTSWFQSQSEASYGRASVLEGLMRSPAAMGLPYGALHYYPRVSAGPSFYLRDPVTLAAQNCCAKCGMQFRMTSDLVYHMRTHHHQHKGAGKDDEEGRSPLQGTAVSTKYRCDVCHEIFKEKHHLSRHMTSHD